MASPPLAPAQQPPGTGGPGSGSRAGGGWGAWRAGTLGWVTLHSAANVTVPPGARAGHWAKRQTTNWERPRCLVWQPHGRRLPPHTPTDGQTDGQPAVLAAAAPGRGHASHRFVFCSGYGCFLQVSSLLSVPWSTAIRETQTRGCLQRGAALFAGQLCPVKPAAGTK